jgi:hypothetical protein
MNHIEISNWKQEAERLFFDGGLSIVEINGSLGISTKSISSHLNSLPGSSYRAERERRKKANADRSGYFRDYRRKERALVNHGSNTETLKREHITAVRILSKERFFRE